MSRIVSAGLALTSCVLSLSLAPVVVASPSAAGLAEGSLERVSSSVGGGAGNGGSSGAIVSGDGRSVAFMSQASDLLSTPVEAGTNNFYLRDLTTGTTSLIDIPPGTFPSNLAGLSHDGRYLAYQTVDGFTPGPPMRGTTLVRFDSATGKRRVINATPAGVEIPLTSVSGSLSRSGRYFAYQGLVRSDGPDRGYHLYRWDARTGETLDLGIVGPLRFGLPGTPTLSTDGNRILHTRVTVRDGAAVRTRHVLDVASGTSVAVLPDSPTYPGDASTVSASGRFVLLSDVVDGTEELFLHDTRRGRVTRVSWAPAGSATRSVGQISADGRVVVYIGYGSRLVPSPDDGNPDVFVYDRRTGETRLVSRTPTGQPSSGVSVLPRLSADGRTVVFQSDSTELVPGDDSWYYDIFVWRG